MGGSPPGVGSGFGRSESGRDLGEPCFNMLLVPGQLRLGEGGLLPSLLHAGESLLQVLFVSIIAPPEVGLVQLGLNELPLAVNELLLSEGELLPDRGGTTLGHLNELLGGSSDNSDRRLVPFEVKPLHTGRRQIRRGIKVTLRGRGGELRRKLRWMATTVGVDNRRARCAGDRNLATARDGQRVGSRTARVG